MRACAIAVAMALIAEPCLAGEPPVCAGSVETAGRAAIQAACRELREELAVFPGTTVRVVQVPFLDERSGCVRRGCVVQLRSSFKALEGRPNPEGVPERYLAGKSWSPLSTYAADGPDGTAYAMYRPGAICLVRSEWNHWDDDAGSHPDDSYRLSVGCGHAGETPPE